MDKLTVSSSPHLRSVTTPAALMRDVLIALSPCAVAAVLLFGLKSLYLILTCVISAVLAEAVFCRLCRKKQTVGDLSAAVSGLILALILPSSVALWQAALGAVIAMVAVKGLFGGIGRNFVNPAATARVILLLSFGSVGTAVRPDPLLPSLRPAVDAVSGATPLPVLAGGEGNLPSLADCFFGLCGGAIGETCAAAILLGGLYLLIRRVITWQAPVAFLGSVYLFTALYGAFSGRDASFPLYHLLTGGVMFAAFFMATDYATVPLSGIGRFLFGLGCGLLTVVIRLWGSYPEGASFALLLMNILTPYLDRISFRRPFGSIKSRPSGKD